MTMNPSAARQRLIDKLADCMDPEHAAQFVDEALKEITRPLQEERDAVRAALGLMAGGVGRSLAEEITHQLDVAARKPPL